MSISKLFVSGLALGLALANTTQAQISFEWVTVGDPGNPNDPLTGFQNDGNVPTRGAVPYVYSISKYETTIGQYTAFLNAVAESDPHGLYKEQWGTREAIRGITRIGTPGNYVYHVRNASGLSDGLTSANLPISGVTHLDAVRFVNWLHNGQGNGSTETGAYTISNGQVTKTPDARYWIPTENEWYKAAYYDPSAQGPADDYWEYPWRSDQSVGATIPANYYFTVAVNAGIPDPGRFRSHITYLMDVRSFSNAASYYGTLSQGGNVAEWTEGDAYSGGPHFRGGHWNAPSPNHSLTWIASFFFPPLGDFAGEPGFRVAAVATPPAGGLQNGDTIRFHPRAGHGTRMLGGVFEGSTDGSSYTVLHAITQAPPNGWTEVRVNFDKARYFRYGSPDLGHGNVAEIEFYRSGAKVAWAPSGSPGSWNNSGSTFDKALDGNVDTFFDAQEPNGAFVQLDTGFTTPLGTTAGHDHLEVTNAPGSGDYQPGRRIPINVLTSPDGQQFAGWSGFTSILDDPTSPSTTVTIPGWGINMRLTATFKALPPGSHILEVIGGSGDGTYPTGTTVTVSADPPPAGQQFAGWSGDIAILSNPFLATTAALVPARNVSITATYSAVGSTDTIRFYPRLFHTARMVGGVFEGTSGDPVNGPYTTIYTISSNPALAWNEVQVDLKDYRYLRYRGPTDSFGNVAEIEFYRDGAKLTGASFGTPGSWSGQDSTFDKALDGNIDTFFDAPISTGAYVGIDTGSAPISSDKIRFYPRLFHTARMIGGVFEGTHGDPVSGPYTTIYTIPSNPPLAWTEVEVDLKDYRYLRYRGSTESFANVAEIEFYRDGVKLTDAGFGTPGSWSGQGSTFDKALDGNVSTFFDAPNPSGAYLGIATQ